MLGIGALASLGLALPTGMAFGYGYGYGVRAGYNAYRQPSSEVQKLKLSPNPVTGALGAGLQSAEERTGQTVAGLPTMTDEPSLSTEAQKITTQPKKSGPEYVYNNDGSPMIGTHGKWLAKDDDTWIQSPITGEIRRRDSFKSHEDKRFFMKGIRTDSFNRKR